MTCGMVMVVVICGLSRILLLMSVFSIVLRLDISISVRVRPAYPSARR